MGARGAFGARWWESRGAVPASATLTGRYPRRSPYRYAPQVYVKYECDYVWPLEYAESFRRLQSGEVMTSGPVVIETNFDRLRDKRFDFAWRYGESPVAAAVKAWLTVGVMEKWWAKHLESYGVKGRESVATPEKLWRAIGDINNEAQILADKVERLTRERDALLRVKETGAQLIAEQKAEIDRLKAELASAIPMGGFYCIHCRYWMQTREDSNKHLLVCEKHPMRAVERERDALKVWNSNQAMAFHEIARALGLTLRSDEPVLKLVDEAEMLKAKVERLEGEVEGKMDRIRTLADQCDALEEKQGEVLASIPVYLSSVDVELGRLFGEYQHPIAVARKKVVLTLDGVQLDRRLRVEVDRDIVVGEGALEPGRGYRLEVVKR